MKALTLALTLSLSLTSAALAGGLRVPKGSDFSEHNVILKHPADGLPGIVEQLDLSSSPTFRGSTLVLYTKAGREIPVRFLTKGAARSFGLNLRSDQALDLTDCAQEGKFIRNATEAYDAYCEYSERHVSFECGYSAKAQSLPFSPNFVLEYRISDDMASNPIKALFSRCTPHHSGAY